MKSVSGISFVLFCSCDRMSLEPAGYWLMVMLHYLMHCVFNWHTYPEGPGEELIHFFFFLVRHTGMNLPLYFLFTFFSFSFFLYLLFTWTVIMVGLHVRGG